MKKSFIKIICLLLSVMLMTSFVSCGGDTAENKVIINSFEVFDRDIQLLNVFNRFGRLEENVDKKYVKSGEKSLHVMPFGGRIISNTANPFFMIPTTSNRFPELNYCDFSKVSKVSFWIYNAEETELNVGIGFQVGDITTVGGRPAADKVQRTATEYYTIKNGWNYVDFAVRHEYLKLHGIKINEVMGIAIEFDYVWSNDFEDAPDLYIDDLSLSYVNSVASNPITLNVTKKIIDGRESWVFLDYETPDQPWYFYARMSTAPMAGQPVVKQVFAGDYGALTDASGAQGMLMNKKHGAGQRGNYIGLFMYGEIMKLAMDAVGSDLYKNPQNYALSFDVFNASDVVDGFSVAFVGTATGSSLSINPGEWKTWTSISFAELNKRPDLANYPNGFVYTETPGAVRFAWSDYSSTENYNDRPFILDNFRIVKIA